ncbi:MAG: ATP synthase F1 subunit epsilon [Eubacteriales bacterium]|nr:ATP synthase F1 subunit epsilon [Eubacteriales bacterium]
MKTFQLYILAADKVLFEGKCESLIVPSIKGRYGIKANHSNTISAIVSGMLSYKAEGEEMKAASVSDGMLKIENNEVLVLVDSAEKPEEIDVNRAKKAEAAAKEELLQKRSIQEYRAAQAHLARAISRLNVKKHTVN